MVNRNCVFGVREITSAALDLCGALQGLMEAYSAPWQPKAALVVSTVPDEQTFHH